MSRKQAETLLSQLEKQWNPSMTYQQMKLKTPEIAEQFLQCVLPLLEHINRSNT